VAVLDCAARPAEMDAGAEYPDFLGDLGDLCGRKGGTTAGSRDSVRLTPSSPRGAGGGGGGGAR
jgi:hypothetical protein